MVDVSYKQAKATADQARHERMRVHVALTYLFDGPFLSGVTCSCPRGDMNLKMWKLHLEKVWVGA